MKRPSLNGEYLHTAGEWRALNVSVMTQSTCKPHRTIDPAPKRLTSPCTSWHNCLGERRAVRRQSCVDSLSDRKGHAGHSDETSGSRWLDRACPSLEFQKERKKHYDLEDCREKGHAVQNNISKYHVALNINTLKPTQNHIATHRSQISTTIRDWQESGLNLNK